MNDLHACDHASPAVDADDRLRGTWQDRRDGERIKIVCRCCGEFHDYRSEAYVRQQLEYERRYREQLARRNCPGCGEDAFLG